MKLFTCTDHDGHYNVGVASIVMAEDEAQARKILDAKLTEHGLKPHAECPYALRCVALEPPFAVVLNDGDY